MEMEDLRENRSSLASLLYPIVELSIWKVLILDPFLGIKPGD
jgi:hypothetical protein